MNERTPVDLCGMIEDARPMAIGGFIAATGLVVVFRKLVVTFTTVKLSIRSCTSSQWLQAERPVDC